MDIEKDNVDKRDLPKPSEWQVQVDRYNDRTEVFHGFPANERVLHIARRIEATGEIQWFRELDADSKAAVVRILAKVPRHVALNRAQRRRMKALKRTGRAR